MSGWELGLTIPLQRFTHSGPLPPGRRPGTLFCWDLHRITLGGADCLLAVNCANRYTLVVYAMTSAQWKDLPGVMEQAVGQSWGDLGIPPEQTALYWRRAVAAVLTRTHGRREVAFLNRAWVDAVALAHTIDPTDQRQPLLEQAVNHIPCRSAGWEGLGEAARRLEQDLEKLAAERP